MKKKILFILFIVSLLLLSGCSTIDKQKCINSGGKWHSGYIGPAGSSSGGCDCARIGGKTVKMDGNLVGVECIPIKEAGLICCKDTRRIPAGDDSIIYVPLKKEECIGDYLEIVEDSLC